MSDREAAIREDWWEKPGRMEDLERRFRPDGLLRLARSTQEYYDSHGHYLPGVAVLAMTYRAELAAARERIAKHVTHAEMLEFALGNANERERLLREALRQIKDYEWHPGQPPTPDVRGIARAALDAAGEQS